MTFEIASGQESTLAGVALVGTFAGVRANVLDEDHLGREVLGADVALESSLSCGRRRGGGLG